LKNVQASDGVTTRHSCRKSHILAVNQHSITFDDLECLLKVISKSNKSLEWKCFYQMQATFMCLLRDHDYG